MRNAPTNLSVDQGGGANNSSLSRINKIVKRACPCMTCPHLGPTPTIEFFEANSISRAELASQIGVSASTVKRWARRGIPYWHRESLRRLQVQLLHSKPGASIPAVKEAIDDFGDL